MPAHRRYGHTEKVVAVLAADMTSVEAAAEAAGIPRTTLAYWLERPEFVELRHNARERMAEEVLIVARLAWQKVAEALAAGRFEPRDLVILAGVASDKSQLLNGAPTSRTEVRDITDGMDDHERAALRDLFDDIAREAAEAAAAAPSGDTPLIGAGVRE